MKTSLYVLCISLAISMTGMQAAWAGPFPDTHPKAIQLYKAGIALKKNGQLEAARQRFAAAIKADSNFTAAYSELGDIYFAGRSYEEALRYGRKAQQLGAATASRLIGFSCYYLRQYEEALEALQQARIEEPANKDIPFQLAQLYAQLGNYSESIRFYEAVLKLDQKHSISRFQAGLMYYNVGDYTSAAASFEKAASLGYPQDALFFFNSGVTWIQLQQTERGISDLRKAQQLQSDDEMILYNLAHACYQNNQFKEAATQWEHLLRLQPGNAFVMFMLGKSYMGMGEQEKGTTLCDKALAIGIDKEKL
ncbi:tetratricopeptide repeat protein [Chitinophaga vietnamensis]|uniref:tetratricopeptide repeat protein n=1 Tax=Chitinophaga vietnamensis TaxID=2593957 RepID=UPI001178018D|nr:tetratricopeptide repeat protein [Chitinophaga vietnamensis]